MTFNTLPHNGRVLWVTSPGGHLTELMRIANQIGQTSDSLWVTSDTPQARGMLERRNVLWVDYVAPRAAAKAITVSNKVLTTIRGAYFDACVSSGAALAAAVLPRIALRGIPTYYIESLARTSGSSTTGRLMQWSPKVHTYTQYQSWTNRRWRYDGSILDGWHSQHGGPLDRPLRLLVTLGTIRPYRFDRLIEAVKAVLTPEDSVIWQTGRTDYGPLPGEVHDEISYTRLSQYMREVDVVVSHAGVGSILQSLGLGKAPVLGVRSARYQEHVDNHQAQFAMAVAGKGLASIIDLGGPQRSTLLMAASSTIHTSDTPDA